MAQDDDEQRYNMIFEPVYEVRYQDGAFSLTLNGLPVEVVKFHATVKLHAEQSTDGSHSEQMELFEFGYTEEPFGKRLEKVMRDPRWTWAGKTPQAIIEVSPRAFLTDLRYTVDEYGIMTVEGEAVTPPSTDAWEEYDPAKHIHYGVPGVSGGYTRRLPTDDDAGEGES